MKKIGFFLLWTLVFVAIVLAADQLLVRVELKTPVLAEARAFWVDFRARLLGLRWELPSFPDRQRSQPAARPAKKAESRPAPPAPAPEKAAGYVWADAKGELRFADTLDQVPPAYRKEAQPLAR
jgi:hypothetical protein